MNCPKCESKTITKDTRHTVNMTRRRKHCLSCGFKFTTHETLWEKDCKENIAVYDLRDAIKEIQYFTTDINKYVNAIDAITKKFLK